MTLAHENVIFSSSDNLKMATGTSLGKLNRKITNDTFLFLLSKQQFKEKERIWVFKKKKNHTQKTYFNANN